MLFTIQKVKNMNHQESKLQSWTNHEKITILPTGMQEDGLWSYVSLAWSLMEYCTIM